MAATLGERLKRARITKQLRQADVAEALGVSHVKISQWETGVHVPTAPNLDRLAQLYGTTTEWLLRGDGKSPLTENVTRGTVREAVEAYGAGLSSADSSLPEDLDRMRSEFEHDLIDAGISVIELQFLRRLLYAPELPRVLEHSTRPRSTLQRLQQALASWLADQVNSSGDAAQAQRDRLARAGGGARGRMQQRLLDIVDEAQHAEEALPPGVKQSQGGEPVERPAIARKRSGKPA